MKNRRNFYRVLHVQPDAPAPVITSSYRAIMQKLRAHPDLGGDSARASLINEAYEVLSNPEKRARYDQLYKPWFIEEGAQRHSNPPGNRPDACQEPLNNYPQSNATGQECYFCGTRNTVEFSHLGEANCVNCVNCVNCDSPLTPAQFGSQSIDSKRSFERTSRRGKMTFFTHHGHLGVHGSVRDLSPKGMGFCTTVKLETGSVIKIECDEIRAVSRIISCNCVGQFNAKNFAIGVDFITVGFSRAQGSFVYETV